MFTLITLTGSRLIDWLTKKTQWHSVTVRINYSRDKRVTNERKRKSNQSFIHLTCFISQCVCVCVCEKKREETVRHSRWSWWSSPFSSLHVPPSVRVEMGDFLIQRVHHFTWEKRWAKRDKVHTLTSWHCSSQSCSIVNNHLTHFTPLKDTHILVFLLYVYRFTHLSLSLSASPSRTQCLVDDRISISSVSYRVSERFERFNWQEEGEQLTDVERTRDHLDSH